MALFRASSSQVRTLLWWLHLQSTIDIKHWWREWRRAHCAGPVEVLFLRTPVLFHAVFAPAVTVRI